MLSTLLAPISWGTTYVTVTELLPPDRPLLVAAARVVPAGAVLALGGFVASRWRPAGAEWRGLAVLALFNCALFFPLLIVSVYRLPGGVAAAVGGMLPLLVAGLTLLITGERPRPITLLVGVVAVIGVAMVVLRPGGGIDAIGVLAAVAANVSFAIGVVLTRRYPAPSDQIAATGWQLLLSGVVLVPLALLVEGRPPAPTSVNILGFVYLSLVATGLAFTLWFNGIRRLPAASPPLLSLAAPLTGAALGWVLLDQSLTPVQIAGFAVTTGAIAYGATFASAVPDGRVSAAHRPEGSGGATDCDFD